MVTKEDTIEIWEVQTKGTVWVYVRDPRDPSGYRTQRVGGPNGTKRLRISADDREYSQEMVLEENAELDPFRNGALKRADGASNEGIITDEDLSDMLELSPDIFDEAVREMASELTVRRLKDLVEERGTVAQLQVINEIIEEKYKVGGTQRTVREMIEAQEIAGGEVVSG